MTKLQIQTLVRKKLNLQHGGSIFNLVQVYYNEHKKLDENVIDKHDGCNWNTFLKVVNHDKKDFKKWIKEKAKKKVTSHLDSQLIGKRTNLQSKIDNQHSRKVRTIIETEYLNRKL